MQRYVGGRFSRPYRAVALAVVVAMAGGCGRNSGSEAEGPKAVYVCTETKAVIVDEPQQTPAVNPETGRRTLMPGLYCSKCRRWHPAPPVEIAQRQPGAAVCPEHGTPLTADGPLPTSETRE